MNRNFKILGLTAVSLLALCAVAVAGVSASAFKFKSENGLITNLTGIQHGTNVDEWTTDSGTIKCTEAKYEGEQFGAESTEVEIEPVYTGCKIFSFLEVTIHMNGCAYRLKTVTKENGNFEGSVDIVCPPGTQIEMTLPNCVITVPPQPGLQKITYTNLGTGTTRERTLDISLTGITYEEDIVAEFSSCTGNGQHTSNGTLRGALLLTGENTSHNHIGIWVE